jgi:hypothetical protein
MASATTNVAISIMAPVLLPKTLFDHLVGEDVELRRNGQAELVGSRAVEAARWHCVRYVMAITKKRFSLPNCAKRTAHS